MYSAAKKICPYISAAFLVLLILLFGDFLKANASQIDAIEAQVDKIVELSPGKILQEDDFEYVVLNNDTVAILDYFGDSTNITYPSELGGKKVEAVFGDYRAKYYDPLLYTESFRCDNYIYGIKFSEGIKYIGHFGYDYCLDFSFEHPIADFNDEDIKYDCVFRKLHKVLLPKSLVEIQDKCFIGLPVSSIEILQNNDEGEDGRFRFPSEINYIGNYAFAGCTYLKNLILPEKLDKIYEGSFEYCSILENAVLPSELKSISSSAFYGCEKLSSITFPEKLEDIGEQAFSWTGLTKIDLLPSLTLVREEAFSNCLQLTEAEFWPTVYEIEKNAFEGCLALNKLTINGAYTILNYPFGKDYEESGLVYTTISAKSGSSAIDYAKNHGIKYEIIESDKTIDEPYDSALDSMDDTFDSHSVEGYGVTRETTDETFDKTLENDSVEKVNSTSSETESVLSSNNETSTDESIVVSEVEDSDNTSNQSDTEKSSQSTAEDSLGNGNSNGTTIVIIILVAVIVLMGGGFAIYILKFKKK